MNIGETPTWPEQCWTILRALKVTTLHLARLLNIAKDLHERWTTVVPDSVKSILFICRGNICRSPLAAVYFKSLVDKGVVSITVRSAGLETTPGKPAHTNSKAVAVKQQLSLDAHTTAQVHAELISQSDLIVVMEIAQKNRVHSLFPHTRGKVLLLGYFDTKGPLEISDPYSGTLDDFQFCFQRIARCCDNLADRLGMNGRKQPTGHVSTVSSEVACREE